MDSSPIEELKEIQGCISLEYKLNPKTSNSSSSMNIINYLFDYSKYLIRQKMYDPQIVNWQIENSALLKQMGLNFNFIKKKMDERNKDYYKYDTLLSQLTYRLEKHGQLAPLKEISKKLTDEDLKPDPELKKSINDINYYNQNDSFIDDEEAYTGEEHDGFFNLNLAYGNYTEDDIMNNLNRNRNRLKKKKTVKSKAKVSEVKEEDGENNDTNQPLQSTNVPTTHVNNGNDIEIKIKTKKRKFGEGIKNLTGPTASLAMMQQQLQQQEQYPLSSSSNNNNNDSMNQSLQLQCIDIPHDKSSEEDSLRLQFNALMKEYCELGNGIPLTEREKELFVKKIVPAMNFLEPQWIVNPLSYTNFLKIFSSLLNINQSHYKILFEYERFRIKIEGIYSNYAKMINQFVIFLTEQSIKDIRNMTAIQEENSDAKDKTQFIAGKVFNYVKIYNDYIGTIPTESSQREEYYKVLEMYVVNVKEKNEEYLIKLGLKIKELFEKAKIEYSIEAFVKYFDKVYEGGDEKDKDKDHEIEKEIDRKRFSIGDFFKMIDSKGKSYEGGLPAKKKKPAVAKGSAFMQMPVINLSSDQNIPDDNANPEGNDDNIDAPIVHIVPPVPLNIPIIKSISSDPNPIPIPTPLIHKHKLLPDSITNYHIQLVPLISKHYYTCQYQDDHFTTTSFR